VDLFDCLNTAGSHHDQHWLRVAICPLSDGSMRQKQRNHRSLLSVNQVRAGFTGRRQANDHRRSPLISAIISCTFTSSSQPNTLAQTSFHTDFHDDGVPLFASGFRQMARRLFLWSCQSRFRGEASVSPAETDGGRLATPPTRPRSFEAHRQVT